MSGARPFDLPPGVPVRPLRERMRTAEARAVAFAGTTEAPVPRAAFTPPRSDADLTRAIEESPEFQRRLQAARQKAEQEGLAAAQARIDALIERYTDALDRLERALRSARLPRASEVVDLGLAIARAVIGRETELDAAALVHDIQEAMAVIDDGERPTLRVCAQDAARIGVLLPELGQRLHLIPDAELAPGGFILENQDRIIDGTVDARLEAVRLALITLVAAGDPQASGAPDEVAP